jgi:hypothetical protein
MNPRGKSIEPSAKHSLAVRPDGLPQYWPADYFHFTANFHFPTAAVKCGSIIRQPVLIALGSPDALCQRRPILVPGDHRSFESAPYWQPLSGATGSAASQIATAPRRPTDSDEMTDRHPLIYEKINAFTDARAARQCDRSPGDPEADTASSQAASALAFSGGSCRPHAGVS